MKKESEAPQLISRWRLTTEKQTRLPRRLRSNRQNRASAWRKSMGVQWRSRRKRFPIWPYDLSDLTDMLLTRAIDSRNQSIEPKKWKPRTMEPKERPFDEKDKVSETTGAGKSFNRGSCLLLPLRSWRSKSGNGLFRAERIVKRVTEETLFSLLLLLSILLRLTVCTLVTAQSAVTRFLDKVTENRSYSCTSCISTAWIRQSCTTHSYSRTSCNRSSCTPPSCINPSYIPSSCIKSSCFLRPCSCSLHIMSSSSNAPTPSEPSPQSTPENNEKPPVPSGAAKPLNTESHNESSIPVSAGEAQSLPVPLIQPVPMTLQLSVPLPQPGTSNMPYFSGKNATEFFRSFDRLCTAHHVDEKERLNQLPSIASCPLDNGLKLAQSTKQAAIKISFGW